MSDSTSFIYIPPVPDSTGPTTVQLVAANSLTNEFSNQSAPAENQANKVSSSLDSIKNSISGIPPGDYTPPELIDNLATQSLDAAFKSTAWLAGEDALSSIQEVQEGCKVFGSSDLSEMVGEMASGVLDDAMGAIGDVADSMKSDFPGLGIPELGIAKSLSDIINTGRTAFDQTKTAFSGIVSSALEHGKAGLAIAENAISKVGAAVTDALTVDKSTITAITGALKGLDSMIQCADSMGGSAISSKTTEMVDKSNEIFDKLGVESDPESPNFGEFDEDAYLDSIGGMTSQQKSNILKLTNVYNQSTNNAGTAVDKAARDAKPSIQFEKSTSSLSKGANKQKLEDKVDYVIDNTPVVVEVPPVPPVAAQAPTAISPTVTQAKKPQPAKTETLDPEPTPNVITTAPIVVKSKLILFSNLFERIDFNIENTNYDLYDPEHEGYPQYRQQLMNFMPIEGVSEQYVGTKVVMGLMGMALIQRFVEEDDFERGGQFDSTRISLQANFAWGITLSPNLPYSEFITNVGSSSSVYSGNGYGKPEGRVPRGQKDRKNKDAMIGAVLDVISQIQMRVKENYGYLSDLFENN